MLIVRFSTMGRWDGAVGVWVPNEGDEVRLGGVYVEERAESTWGRKVGLYLGYGTSWRKPSQKLPPR